MKKTITYNEVKKTCLDIINGGGGGGGTTLKTLSFVGSGDIMASNTINIPNDCHMILGINGHGVVEDNEFDVYTGTLFKASGVMKALVTTYTNGEFEDGFEINMLHSFSNNQMTFESIDDGNAFAYPITFTVYYI